MLMPNKLFDFYIESQSTKNFYKNYSAVEILKTIGIVKFSNAINYSKLPFTPLDVTAGVENELQAAVLGTKENVDLPLTILSSNYYGNILKRMQSGELDKRTINAIENYLNNNDKNIWENSFIRLYPKYLSLFARRILLRDLLADKKCAAKGFRTDVMKFIVGTANEEKIRLPVSYLLKLSLADVIGCQQNAHLLMRRTAYKLLKHYSNDNTSPETFSFYVVPISPEYKNGVHIAKETSIRFLLSTLLIEYANRAFHLKETGQEVIIYFSPHPPIRQQYLNNIISDSFYRELFINPCLGWNKAEEKYHYMILCHQVLSRSHLNTLFKLKEAGIITNNLVTLPNTSNISLSNNGTHISLGSRQLSSLMATGNEFNMAHEKYLGDLVIKIVEHFLPLFVGTYTADPYRIDYTDFHPEKVLGFLPHELHYTHLRMIWRRWKKKAHINFLGRSLTPFGPPWIDEFLKKIFKLRGDFVNDFRLISYLVSLLSTEQHSGLNGMLNNTELLKMDLAEMGVFDSRMSVYQLYRLREYNKMSFSGFEGRYYSLFKQLRDDMGYAVTLQIIVTGLAYKYMAEGKVSHETIPDDPFSESERRQIFFAAAIGIPTFFVKKNSSNQLLRRILMITENIRSSRRYPDYVRVYVSEYRKALLKIILKDAKELIDMWSCTDLILDLERRLEEPDKYSATGKLLNGILKGTKFNKAIKISANEFNQMTEDYYRNELRMEYLKESFEFLEEEVYKIESKLSHLDNDLLQAISYITPQNKDLCHLLRDLKKKFLNNVLQDSDLIKLINILLLDIAYNQQLWRNDNKYDAK